MTAAFASATSSLALQLLFHDLQVQGLQTSAGG
jgi:hypothetical protein